MSEPTTSLVVGNATPEPATPEPATPEPATPEPATPEPATPEPATPEPATPDNAYQSIINQQNEQIAALLAHTEALSEQITRLVTGGAQFSTTGQSTPQPPVNPMQQFNGSAMSDGEDYSLEALGKMIGRKNG